jgi:hypothetical protein
MHAGSGALRRSTMPVLAGLAAAAVVAASASAAGTAVGPLKICAFVSAGDLTNSEIVKVFATGSTGIKGTLTFTGAGLNQTVPFKMGKGGVALNSLTISTAGKATVTVVLSTKPPKKRVLHLVLSDTMGLTQDGCTPK